LTSSSETSGPGVGQLLQTIPWASSGRFSGTRWDLLVYERGLLALRNKKPMGSKWTAWVSIRARERWIEGQEERVGQLSRMPPERLLKIHAQNALITYDQITEGRLYASAVDTRLMLKLADGRELAFFWAHGDSLLGEISPSDGFDVIQVAFEHFLGDKLVASRESLLGQESGVHQVPVPQVVPDRRQVAPPVQVAPVQHRPAQQTSWAAAWYPDPTGQARLRYWDGSSWTAHTAS
jgi:Protein of unknown function (DUF2510)